MIIASTPTIVKTILDYINYKPIYIIRSYQNTTGDASGGFVFQYMFNTTTQAEIPQDYHMYINSINVSTNDTTCIEISSNITTKFNTGITYKLNYHTNWWNEIYSKYEMPPTIYMGLFTKPTVVSPFTILMSFDSNTNGKSYTTTINFLAIPAGTISPFEIYLKNKFI